MEQIQKRKQRIKHEEPAEEPEVEIVDETELTEETERVLARIAIVLSETE